MNDILLREARADEIDEILKLYDELFDSFDKTVNYPRWTRGQYPNRDYLEKTLGDHSLFVLIKDGQLTGVSVLNSSVVENYGNVDWTVDFPKDKVLCIHTFAVRENLRFQNYGSIFIEKILDYAREMQYQAIHLDTIRGNTPAVRFYEKNGFTNLGKYELEYEDTDEREFILFEYIL